MLGCVYIDCGLCTHEKVLKRPQSAKFCIKNKLKNVNCLFFRERIMELEKLNEVLPSYKCSKVVQAAKIIEIKTWPDGIIDIKLECPIKNYITARIDAEWANKHAPNKGGYLILYKDGYLSYSPQKAFEDSYTVCDDYRM